MHEQQIAAAQDMADRLVGVIREGHDAIREGRDAKAHLTVAVNDLRVTMSGFQSASAAPGHEGMVRGMVKIETVGSRAGDSRCAPWGVIPVVGLAIVSLVLAAPEAQERPAPDPATQHVIHVDPSPLPHELAEMVKTPRRRALASVDPCAGQPATGPCAWPRATLAGTTIARTWRFDWPDGAGGDISYSSGAMGISEDGRYAYIACNTVAAQRGLAKVEIPTTSGGLARVVAPCQGPTRTEIDKILPGGGGGTAMIGGVLEQGGRVVVTAFFSYDANGQTIASHWMGASLQTLAGPFAGTVSPGLVKSQMGVIPLEWRALLGGPAFSTAGYTSIISRASYGAAFSVFDPATVTSTGFPMQMLLGCPHSVPACRTYGTPTSDDYNGSELSGTAFIIPGTRTLAVIEREASGPTCYGYATRTRALHGTPYPDAVNPSPENVVWCYSLSDPLYQKGPKGYPYRLVGKLYDLAELVAVKQGQRNPWDVKQYATVDLPGSTPSAFLTGAAYDPMRGELHALFAVGGGVNTVTVYSGFAPAQPPPTPAPTGTITATPTAIVRGQTVTLAGTLAHAPTATITPRIGTVSGATWTATDTPTAPTTYTIAATTSAGTWTASVAVDVTPPPPPSFIGRVRSQATFSRGGLVAGIRVTLQVPASMVGMIPPRGGAIVLALPLVDGAVDRRSGTVYRMTPNYGYSGAPTDAQVVVEFPGMSAIAIAVEVP